MTAPTLVLPGGPAHRDDPRAWTIHDGGTRYTSGLTRSYATDWRTGVSLRALREHLGIA